MKITRNIPASFSRYLPIDDTLFHAPLYITSAGRALIPPGPGYPPDGHPDLYQFKWREGRVLPEFSVLWIERGGGLLETRTGAFPVRAGEVALTFSGQWHRYRPDPKTGWIESWIQFNGRLAHELEKDGFLNPSSPVQKPANPKYFARDLRHLLQAISSPTFVNSTSQGLKLGGLLAHLNQHSASGSSTALTNSHSPEQTLTDQARQHIWSHSHRQLNVDEIARHLGVSRRTLERAFTAEGKSTAGSEITRCRLNRAERLLKETFLPVEDIVRLSGFGTYEQMRLHFQERHRCSPLDYRKQGSAG